MKYLLLLLLLFPLTVLADDLAINFQNQARPDNQIIVTVQSTVTVVDEGELPPGPGTLFASANMPYTYASRCSTGGRGARTFPCQRAANIYGSALYQPYYLNDPVNLVLTFWVNTGKAQLNINGTPLIMPGVFDYSFTLLDHVTQLPVATTNVSAGQYDLIWNTPSFTPGGFSLTIN